MKSSAELNSLKKFISEYGVTTAAQLIDISKKLKINLKFIGLTNNLKFMKPIVNGSYIINIGDKQGTHWTGFYIQDNEALYFDSYAAAPEDDLIDILNSNSKVNKVLYNNDFDFQTLDENLCGVWTIIFLYHMTHSKKKNLVDRFNDMKKNYKDLL